MRCVLAALAVFCGCASVASTTMLPDASPSVCLQELRAQFVPVRIAEESGIADPVEVLGRLGGVEFRGYSDAPLVIDCALVRSLVAAGKAMAARGISAVRYSSAYQRRNVRGSSNLSKHSYGLAIDVHEFISANDTLRVKEDYEQGLGDDANCLGSPLSAPGKVLRELYCEWLASGVFELILGPDDDFDHYNHFHLQAAPRAEQPSE